MKKRLVAAAVTAFVACLVCALCGCTGPYDPNESMKEPTVDGAALKEAGTLHVGVDASTYPFAGQSQSRMSGIDVDLSAAIAQELGLKVDFVDVGADGVEALSGDQVDMVMRVEESAADGKCWLSETYEPSVIALFSLDEKAGVPEKSDKPVIAVATGSKSESLVKRQYGDDAVYAVDDPKAAFEELKNNTVAYVAIDAVVGAFVSNELGTGAHLIGMMQQPDNYCMGIATENVELQTAVAEALSTLKANGTYDLIMVRWTGGPVDVSNAGLTDAAKSEPKKIAASKSNEADKAIAANADGKSGKVGANAVTTTN